MGISSHPGVGATLFWLVLWYESWGQWAQGKSSTHDMSLQEFLKRVLLWGQFANARDVTEEALESV